MKKYKGDRSNVYVGTVVIPKDVEVLENGIGHIVCYKPVRSIMYSVGYYCDTVDLLNKDVSHYPIEGYVGDNELLSSEYAVVEDFKLEELLVKLGYPEKLTSGDLKRIRRQLFRTRDIEELKYYKSFFGRKEQSAYDKHRDLSLADAIINHSSTNQFVKTKGEIKRS